MQKFLYRVKAGYTHGALNQYKTGDVVEHTEAEAAGFLDKLERVGPVGPVVIDSNLVSGDALNLNGNGQLVVTTPGAKDEGGSTKHEKGEGSDASSPDPQPSSFSVADATVDEVLAAVKAGEITAADALIAEQQGKKRATLIEALTKATEAEGDKDEDAASEQSPQE